MTGSYQKNILVKLQTLPTEMLVEVEDFIDFLKAKHSKNLVSKSIIVEEPRSLYGSAKGLIVYIAGDFNEPLDDLKEYM